MVGYWLSDCALDRLRMRQAVVIGGGFGGRVGSGRTMGGAARGLIGAGCDSYRQKKAPVKGLRGWGWGLQYDPSGSEYQSNKDCRTHQGVEHSYIVIVSPSVLIHAAPPYMFT